METSTDKRISKRRPALVRIGRIEGRVLRVRGHSVMLDSDLAVLYGVAVKALNQAVKRNRERFPADFMFRLTAQEERSLRSQFVTSKPRRGGRRSLPYAFTEQGVAMLSSVLRSSRAIRVNVEIMRAFVRLRQMLDASTKLAIKLYQLEEKCDKRFAIVFEAIRDLTAMPSSAPRRRIGFAANQNGPSVRLIDASAVTASRRRAAR